MYNVGGAIIGLHDPRTKTIRFNSVFIGKQNVAQGYKNEDLSKWYVSLTLYYDDSTTTMELTGTDVAPFCTIDGNGVLTYDKAKFEAEYYGGDRIKPYYTAIKVNCRAYQADADNMEDLTFLFRYNQIAA